MVATTEVTSSLNPSTYADSVTFTATASSTSGTPTGTVTFYDDTTELGSATLSSGQATYTTAALSASYHSITAVYGGDINFDTSTSDALVQAVVASTSYPTTTVMVDGYQMIGAKGNLIYLVENPSAVDPTYDQLLNFLRNDDTDQQTYDKNTFVCADFAQMLQNHAEEVGWNCAWVSIEFAEQSEGHALNAFQTTDKGLVFIDDTGSAADQAHPSNMDKTVDVEVGQAYTPVSLFPESGWYSTWDTIGVVSKVDVIW